MFAGLGGFLGFVLFEPNFLVIDNAPNLPVAVLEVVKQFFGLIIDAEEQTKFLL